MSSLAPVASDAATITTASTNGDPAKPRKPHWRKRPNANRDKRQEISLETVRIFDQDNGTYPSPNGVSGETITVPADLLALPDAPDAVLNYEDATQLGPDADAQASFALSPTTPVIEVADTDCLAEGLRLQQLGYRPLVLNMSSKTNPGGGFRSGAGAQEENLFRRTNLYRYLEPRKRQLYPIPDRGGHYIGKAVVIRDTQQSGYRFLEQPQTMAFVGVPALRRPNLDRDAEGQLRLNTYDRALTRDKIRAILNIGLANGHNAIVLSALGCGAYGNPPVDVAAAFYDVITREYMPTPAAHPPAASEIDSDQRHRRSPWLGYKHISFAIFDDKNAFGKHNKTGNLRPFQEKFASLITKAS